MPYVPVGTLYQIYKSVSEHASSPANPASNSQMSPKKIPRPRNCFQIFKDDHYKPVKEQLKNTNIPTTRKNVWNVLGKMWRELPQEHKSLYVQSAQAEYHQRYPTRYKRQEKTVAAQQTTSADSGFCPQEWTWRQAACRRLRGLPPLPPLPSTAPQPQTLTSLPEPSSPQPTIAPLATDLEAGPLPNSAPDSATDLVSEYMATDGDHYVPSAQKMPVNPQAVIRHLPPDEDLLKQLDEFFGSGPAMSSEIPNTLPVHHDPPKEMDLPGSSCSEPSVCVSPSDLVLLRESSCSPASRGAVKRSTTKKRKRGTYTPWTKAKTRRTTASKPPSSQAQDMMEASQGNADDLKSVRDLCGDHYVQFCLTSL